MSIYWPLGPDATPKQIMKLYRDGFPAAPINPIEQESLFTDNIVIGREAIAPLIAGNPGNGKRALLFRSREKYDPGAFGEESQTDGDCTSHGDRSARDTTRSVEIHIKGEPEKYFLRGATEPTYGARGHRGAGMDPARAARFVTNNGYLVRQNYEGCTNLSNYNSAIGARWGWSGPPQCVLSACKQYPVGKYIVPETPDEAMALFQNGYACHSGQNIGFSATPNRNGIHDRRGSWNHDMATVGYDDTKEIWPSRVYFVTNSWGVWNSQWGKWADHSILGPPISGMIVAVSDVWEQYFLGGGSIYFYGDITGFPIKKLPNYGTSDFL